MKTGAEQHRHIPEGNSLFSEFQDLLTDKPGLHLLAPRLNQVGPFPVGLARHKVLLVPFRGPADDLVGQV